MRLEYSAGPGTGNGKDEEASRHLYQRLLNLHHISRLDLPLGYLDLGCRFSEVRNFDFEGVSMKGARGASSPRLRSALPPMQFAFAPSDPS